MFSNLFEKGGMAMDQISETIRDGSVGHPQILLMEDESSVADGLQMALREEGYGVDLAMTGHNALDTMRHKGFDLLVADLKLPDMDGMEVIKQVRDTKPETEVIVITGYANIPSAVEALKKGVRDYLTKPFTSEEFIAAVEQALRMKKMIPAKENGTPDEAEIEKLIRKSEVIRVLAKDSEDDDALQLALEQANERYPLGDKLLDHIAFIEDEWLDTEEELAKIVDFPKNLIENAVDGIMACDRNGRVIIFNKKLEKLLGYSSEEALGKMFSDQFFPIGAVEQFKQELSCEIQNSENALFLSETDLISKTGNKIPVQLSATLLFEAGEEVGMVIVCKDLKELRKLEQEFADIAQLLHQDKIMSLGRLAASIVHEINNPLTGILNYIRLMITILSRNAPLTPERIEKFQKYLTLVESETSRCSSIVSNLLDYSRKSKLQFSEVNLVELLEKCIMLSQHKLDLENIQVETYLDSNIPNARADFNLLQQCVINLIFNAIDAIPKGGMLTIGCTYNRKEGVAEIRIADNGCGIAKENLSSIFDPFFTTKEEGKGLGLGLSMVSKIIERHNGAVRVESRPGEGTTFTIEIPA